MIHPGQPFFSVITPVFNGENFINRCYTTLLLQSFTNWEWVIINDGSSDTTLEKIRKIHDDRIRVVSYEDNMGRGYARSKALEVSRGEWMVVWDVDDIYFPDRLARIFDAKLKGYDFFCSYVTVVDNKLQIKGIRGFLPSTACFPQGFVHHTLACKIDIARKIGYDPSLRAGEDLTMLFVLPTLYSGFWCEDALTVYQEEREVNLQKAIATNLSHFVQMQKIQKQGLLNIWSLRKWNLKFFIKISILLVLNLTPRLYPLSISVRSYGSTTEGWVLSEEKISFIKSFLPLQM
jgi:glycosyltransferase involved in cell wall biosynthesis